MGNKVGKFDGYINKLHREKMMLRSNTTQISKILTSLYM